MYISRDTVPRVRPHQAATVRRTGRTPAEMEATVLQTQPPLATERLVWLTRVVTVLTVVARPLKAVRTGATDLTERCSRIFFSFRSIWEMFPGIEML